MDSAPAKVFSSHGSKLFFPPDCPVDAAMVFGTYELGTTRLLMRELRPGMVFFDIGAHVGYYTCLAARLVGPQGKVVAFEPHPKNAALLRHNVALNGYENVLVEEKAVSDRIGKKSFYENTAWGSHSLYRYGSGFTGGFLEVETVSLDDFISKHRLQRVDMIKIDAEGSEIPLLCGMCDFLSSSSKKTKFIIEYHPEAQQAAGFNWDAFLKSLRSSGLASIRLIDDEGRLPSVGEAFHMSQTFVNLFCTVESAG